MARTVAREGVSEAEGGKMKASLIVGWHGPWIGIYIDRVNQAVYVFPVPYITVKLQLKSKKIS